jgi:hypothetical protein
MRTPSVICKPLLAMLVLVLMVGCQGKQPAVEEETAPPRSSGSDPRGYDPLELEEDREVVPLTHPLSGEISGQAAFVESAQQEPDTASSQRPDLSGEIDSLSNQAYRIQLFTSKVFGEARYAKQVAEEIFDRPVFMDYEVPYFKVRVGSFADRDGAEEYLMRVRSAGYSDAWVVIVNVRVKETAPLYDRFVLPGAEDDTLPSEMEDSLQYDEPEN